MIFFIKTLLIAILTSVAIPFLPWYTAAAIACLIGALFDDRLEFSFLSGFVGVGVSWALFILIINQLNHGVLAEKMAAVFAGSLGNWLNTTMLICISIFIGALIGGLGAITGSLIREARGARSRRRRTSTYKLNI